LSVCYPKASSDTDAALKRGRVLVVDDHLDIALGCAKLLQSADFEVKTATDGFEDLGIASEFQPNVILLNIGLPGLDGFEVAGRLRDDAILKAITLIAVTAYGSKEARQQAEASGFDHYLIQSLGPRR
jgi:CheY-like chemotaxis protein